MARGVNRGEIWLYDFKPPNKRRPVVVLTRQEVIPLLRTVMVAPVIPGLNDHEIPAILSAAKDAGASFAATIVLRLPHGTKALFGEWLEQHRPDRRERVLSRIRDVRGGSLNDHRFGSRMRGQGIYAQQIQDLFAVQRRRAGLDAPRPSLATEHFRKPSDAQLDLFGG